MVERIRHMVRKELAQVFRDPRMRLFMIGAPLIQLIMFGYAVTTDVRDIRTAVCDRDNSVLSREVLARFVNSGYFRVVARPTTDAEVRDVLDRGTAQGALVVNKGFGRDVEAGRTAPVQLLLDGTDANTARIILTYSTRIVEAFSRDILGDQSGRLRGSFREPPRIELHSRAWFNENLESRNYFIPGVIATIVTLITLMLTSMAVVREKEIGTIEQIIVSPITPLQFILGKTIPFALISLADVVIITVVGIFWFGVPIRGSLVLLFAASGVYIVTMLGIGLLISTVSTTQQQAMISTFLFFMPALLLSGLMFPIANMPDVVQWFTYINPMRYFLVIVRAIFLKGIGVAVLWPQIAALAAMGVATMALAARRFHKTLT
jgi:ABC-2 type transport system permease protein